MTYETKYDYSESNIDHDEYQTDIQRAGITLYRISRRKDGDVLIFLAPHSRERKEAQDYELADDWRKATVSELDEEIEKRNVVAELKEERRGELEEEFDRVWRQQYNEARVLDFGEAPTKPNWNDYRDQPDGAYDEAVDAYYAEQNDRIERIRKFWRGEESATITVADVMVWEQSIRDNYLEYGAASDDIQVIGVTYGERLMDKLGNAAVELIVIDAGVITRKIMPLDAEVRFTGEKRSYSIERARYDERRRYGQELQGEYELELRPMDETAYVRLRLREQGSKREALIFTSASKDLNMEQAGKMIGLQKIALGFGQAFENQT